MTSAPVPQGGLPDSTGLVPVVPVSFWLLPDASDERWLQEVVGDLARQHGGPVFEPRVTLLSARCARAIDIEGILGRLAAQYPALNLEALATAESDVYYRTLFVDIAKDRLDGQRMLDLRRQLVLALRDAHGADAQRVEGASAAGICHELQQALSSSGFRPHVSLLYGNLAQTERAALTQQNDFRGRSIVFDRICAVRPAQGFADMSQVSHWKVFGHRTLNG